MTKQTYDNYYRAYFQKNKDKIREQTKEYRKKYMKERYERIKLEKAKVKEAAPQL